MKVKIQPSGRVIFARRTTRRLTRRCTGNLASVFVWLRQTSVSPQAPVILDDRRLREIDLSLDVFCWEKQAFQFLVFSRSWAINANPRHAMYASLVFDYRSQHFEVFDVPGFFVSLQLVRCSHSRQLEAMLKNLHQGALIERRDSYRP